MEAKPRRSFLERHAKPAPRAHPFPLLPRKQSKLLEVGKTVVSPPDPLAADLPLANLKQRRKMLENRRISNTVGNSMKPYDSERSLNRWVAKESKGLYHLSKERLLSRESSVSRILQAKVGKRPDTGSTERQLRKVLSECQLFRGSRNSDGSWAIEEPSAVNYKITFHDRPFLPKVNNIIGGPPVFRNPTISSLTNALNEKSMQLLRRQAGLQQNTEDDIKQQSELGLKVLNHVSKQLRNLGDRVDTVTKYQDGNSRMLSSNVKHPFEIKGGQDDVLYYKVFARNKPSPMLLRIYAIDTPKDLQIYVSKVHLKPGKQSYQYCNKPGAIDVVVQEQSRSRSVGEAQKQIFQNQYFYIGIYSTLGVQGELLVEFGDLQKHKAQRTMIQTHKYLQALKKKKDPFAEQLDKIMANPQLKKNFYERVKQIKRERIEAALLMAGNRDLIQQNIENIGESRSQTEIQSARQVHHQEVKLRKSVIDEERRRKNVFFMIKRDLQRGKREEEEQAEFEFNEKLFFSQMWPISAILKKVFDFSAERLHSKIQRIVKDRRELRLIKTLQKRSKNYLAVFGKTMGMRATKLAVRSLRLKAGLTVENVHEKAKKTMKNFLREMFERQRLKKSFVLYYEQSKLSELNLVRKLQNMWNEVMKIARMRIDCLSIAWQVQVDEMIMELLTGRGSKTKAKRHELASRLRDIKAQVRNDVLHEYLSQCRIKHKQTFSAWRAHIIQTNSRDNLTLTPVRGGGSRGKKSLRIDPEDSISRAASNFNFNNQQQKILQNQDLLSQAGSSRHKSPLSLAHQIQPPFRPIGKGKDRKLPLRKQITSSRLRTRQMASGNKTSSTFFPADGGFKEQFYELLQNASKPPKRRKSSSRASMHKRQSQGRIATSETIGSLKATSQILANKLVRNASMSMEGEEDINDRKSPEECKREDSMEVIRGRYPSKPPIFRYIPSKELLRSLIIEAASYKN